MHIYIYDSFVSEKKFDKVIARIETRITDLGLNGKIIRLGIMKSAFEMVENEMKKGAKTIVAVGNNNLLNQTINSVAKTNRLYSFNKDIPIGFIPVGKDCNTIAGHLGIGLEEAACDILSARRIQSLDLGLINNHYFLTQANITTKETTVEIDKNYVIEIAGEGEIAVINLPTMALPPEIKPKVNDGVLELLIKTGQAKKLISLGGNKTNQSVFMFKELDIFNKKYPVIIDDAVAIKTPAHITIALEKINFIVGKDRSF